MTPFQIIVVSAVGLFAGVLSGMFGVGGGVVIVPVIQSIAKFHMKEAIGTSLAALLLPCGLPAVISYYKAGDVNVMAAAIIVTGLFIGTFYGANITLGLPDVVVKRAFGVMLLLVGFKYLATRS